MSENKAAFKIAVLGLPLIIMDPFTIIFSAYPVSVCARKKKQLDAFGNEFWKCINSVGCVKKRHTAMCSDIMQGILSVSVTHNKLVESN